MNDFESLAHVRLDCKYHVVCSRRRHRTVCTGVITSWLPNTQAPAGPFPERGSPRCAAGQAKPTPSRRGQLDSPEPISRAPLLPATDSTTPT